VFSNLAKLEITRSGKEALGFYVSYFILGLIFGFIIGALAGILNPDNAEEAGFKAGSISAVIMSVFLSVLICSKKHLFSSFKAISLIAIAALLSVFSGTLGGLIPVAYLTTLKSEKA
jgi:peptidoglycan/LPS O-acetylase OafA/YrhL